MKGSVGQAEEAQEGLASVGELPFLVTAAHELKAPLALVRQLSLALEAGGIEQAEGRRMLRQIVLTSERALRLTADLSRSVRTEDSIFELEPLNLQQLCEEAAHELTPLYKARGREIRVAASRRPSLLAVANHDLLRRVIINFGDNALHYAESSTPVELRAGSLAHGTKVRLGVRDYGPRVPIDIWQRLQDCLGTATQVLHTRPQSSGLGLYVAGQFADAMEGRIGAVRHHDGATFYVDLTASTQLSLL